MRLSVVFELLLVFLFLAFAAARVIDKKHVATATQNGKKLRQGGPNRYCACTTNMCNCCRDFSLPVVPVKGPGCASIMYLKGDNMMISMSFGERVLSNMTIAGPKPKPVCMTLPGGISQFCGRVYGISRTEKNFKACLGLELRALDDIEAALRVSCFKFGPKGVNLESAPPVPTDEPEDEDDEDDEDDYDLGDDEDDDDLIGLGGDLDDDDDDDDDEDGPNAVGNNEGNEVDSDSADYAGFSVLGEDFFGTFFADEESRPKKKKKDPVKKTVKPAVALAKLSTTTRRPIFPVKRPTVRPTKITRKPANKITLLPRPSITKIVSSTSAPTAAAETVPMAPLPSVSIPPIRDPIPSAAATAAATAATLPGGIHKYSTTEKLLVASSQPPSTVPTLQVSYNSEKLNEVNSVKPATESPTLVKITLPSDEVKLPELDLEKIEAMAAIAQQGVTSSVIHSSALPPKESQQIPVTNEIVAEETKTEKYVLVPSIPMVKAGSPPKESEEDEDDEEDDDLLDGIIDDGLDNDDETSGSEEDNEAQSSNDVSDEVAPQKVQLNETSETEKDEVESSAETEKPTKVKLPEKSEEDEEESDDDFFDGIIDGDDDEEEEEEEDDHKKKGDKEEDGEENVKEEEEEEEEDILGAFVADPYESDNEKDESTENTQKDKVKESEEESEEEEDLLNVLGGDDEEQDNSAEEEDDENNKPTLKNKHGNKQQSTVTGQGVNSTTESDKGENSSKDSSSSSSSASSSEEDKRPIIIEQKVNETTVIKVETTEKAQSVATTQVPEEITGTTETAENTETTEIPSTTETMETTMKPNASEIGRFDKVDFVPLPKSDALLLMKAAAKMKEPQVLRLSDFLGPRKTFPPESDKPINTSRTHRRMNLDRWAPI